MIHPTRRCMERLRGKLSFRINTLRSVAAAAATPTCHLTCSRGLTRPKPGSNPGFRIQLLRSVAAFGRHAYMPPDV